MNDIKVSCIDSRKMALTSTYEGNDPKILKMIDEFFIKVEEFAKDCVDVADFESKFASSPLNIEYTNLFTKIMGNNIDLKKEIKEEAVFTGEQIVDDLTHQARMDARSSAEATLRNTPIIGDVMTAKQHFDLFSRFKKKDE